MFCISGPGRLQCTCLVFSVQHWRSFHWVGHLDVTQRRLERQTEWICVQWLSRRSCMERRLATGYRTATRNRPDRRCVCVDRRSQRINGSRNSIYRVIISESGRVASMQGSPAGDTAVICLLLLVVVLRIAWRGLAWFCVASLVVSSGAELANRLECHRKHMRF